MTHYLLGVISEGPYEGGTPSPSGGSWRVLHRELTADPKVANSYLAAYRLQEHMASPLTFVIMLQNDGKGWFRVYQTRNTAAYYQQFLKQKR